MMLWRLNGFYATKGYLMFGVKHSIVSHPLILAATVIAVCLALFASRQSVSAGGMGGINVRPARVCLDGVRFTGTVVNANALHRTIVAEIFAGHVGAPSPLIATGTSQVYTALHQTKVFVIKYPVGTFAVGDLVTYSALANDGSGYGGGQFDVVEACYLFRRHR
jgi:hypothetical protein